MNHRYSYLDDGINIDTERNAAVASIEVEGGLFQKHRNQCHMGAKKKVMECLTTVHVPVHSLKCDSVFIAIESDILAEFLHCFEQLFQKGTFF